MITEVLTNPRILVVVPTYFEVDNIDAVLRLIRAALPSAHVLVIDDGSTDGTRESVMAMTATDSSVELLCRDRKAGLGDAYREGFTRGIADGMDLLVEIDADHSHDPAMLPAMVSAACHGADVVIGSR
ncbi:MAG: glycosyltransferase, partial [Actinobacteria bacterium]|nr:glycosyltransferase [Actinomycetota bacterium]